MRRRRPNPYALATKVDPRWQRLSCGVGFNYVDGTDLHINRTQLISVLDIP